MRGRSLLLVMTVSGCGRLNFEPLVDAAPDPGCWPAWRDHSVRLSAPDPIAELVTSASELDPVIATDNRTLYFARGPQATRDIFSATRAERSAAFEAVMVRPDISSPGEDGKLSLPDDELSLVISADRVAGEFDLWQLSRATTTDAFSAPTLDPLVQVNTAGTERDPHLSGDGLALYYAESTPLGQRIAVATRATTSVPFDPPTLVQGLGTAIAADPAVSPDALVMIFTGGPDVASPGQLYYATRPQPSGPFEAAQPVPDVGSLTDDGDPQLTRDGCELFFSSVRAGNRDLFRATVQ